MFFLYFLYFMDNFYKFLRFYVKFQNVKTIIDPIFVENHRKTNYPKISFKSTITYEK